jgi:hypothetical protein
MPASTKTPFEHRPVIKVAVEPDLYEAGRAKAAATGGNVTGVLRALFMAWLNTPAVPLLPGLTPPEGPPPS